MRESQLGLLRTKGSECEAGRVGFACGNIAAGIYLENSDGNNIIDNIIFNNSCHGIYLYSNSSFDDFINNNITNQFISIGIQSSSSNNIIGNIESGGIYGIYFDFANSNTISSNKFCGNNNNNNNIFLYFSTGNSGDNNTCDTGNWNDKKINGCFYTCSGLPRVCDLNRDEIIISDYNDLISAYKCFLGVNRNCIAINYETWNLMKKEYMCFINNKQ